MMPRCPSLTTEHLLAGMIALVVLGSGCTADAPSRSMPSTGSPASTRAATAAVIPRPTCIPSTNTVRCARVASMPAARVLRIVDGDTLHIDLNGRDETVRLFGVNAPELGQPCADDATARLRELAGGEVRLLPDVRDRDRFGRLLRYVYAPDGFSIDAALVAEGVALAWRQDGALRLGIIALEDGARDGHTGCLWQ